MDVVVELDPLFESSDIAESIWGHTFTQHSNTIKVTFSLGFPTAFVLTKNPLGKVDLYPVEALATYLDVKCNLLPTEEGDSATFTASQLVRFVWLDDLDAPVHTEETHIFEYTFVDSNNRVPVFNMEQLAFNVDSDWDTSLPVDFGKILSVWDEDYSMNIITLRFVGEGSDLFRAEHSWLLPENCTPYWEYEIRIYANEPLPQENIVFELTLEASDGVNGVELPIEITIVQITVPTTTTTTTSTTTSTTTTPPTTTTTPTTTTPTTTTPTTTTPTTSEVTEAPTTTQEPTTTEEPTTTQPPSTTVLPTTIISTTPTTTPTTERPILPDEKLCNSSDTYGRLWVVHYATEGRMPCPGDSQGYSYWYCGLLGEFTTSSPDFSNCSTPWVSNIRDQIRVNTFQVIIYQSKILSNRMKQTSRQLNLWKWPLKWEGW